MGFSSIRMKLIGAAAAPRAETQDRLPGVANYYRGKDPTKWRKNVPLYRRVKYNDIYPGIDLAYRGDGGIFEFDFDLKAGADAGRIALAFDGIGGAHLGSDGNAILQADHGDLTLKRPVAYQQIGGTRRAVPARYEIAMTSQRPRNARVSIALGDYDHKRPLTIDPVLAFSSYFGGTVTKIDGSTIDSSGNVYVTGLAFDCPGCVEFPTTIGQAYNANWDAFASKVSADGTTLLWSTLIGGSQFDVGKAIAVDGTGNAYVAGETFSPDLPTTTGPQVAPVVVTLSSRNWPRPTVLSCGQRIWAAAATTSPSRLPSPRLRQQLQCVRSGRYGFH